MTNLYQCHTPHPWVRVIDYYEKSLEMQRSTLGEGHPVMAKGYRESAMIYHLMKEYRKAYDAMQNAVTIYKEFLSKKDTVLRQTKAELASIKNRLSS